jgi:hypothetical protein
VGPSTDPRHRAIRRLAAALAAAIATAALVAPAGAGRSVASGVTLKVAGGPPFHGRVISKDPACIANRKVVLLELAPERGLIDFADNRTNGKGKWIFSSQLQGATVVAAKVTRQKSAGVLCRAGRSPAKEL